MSWLQTLKSLLQQGLYSASTYPPTRPCFEQEIAAEEAALAVDRAVELLRERTFALIACRARNEYGLQQLDDSDRSDVSVLSSFTNIKSELALIKVRYLQR